MPMKGQSHRPLMPVQGHFAAGFLEQWYAGYQMQSKLSVFLPLLQQNTTMESIKAMAHGLLLFPPNPFSLKSGKAGCLKSQLECHYCCLQKSLNSIKNNQLRLTTSQGSTLKRRKREGKKKDTGNDYSALSHSHHQDLISAFIRGKGAEPTGSDIVHEG